MAVVPALPDSERRTTYTITSQTGPFDVGFAVYGNGTDYENWLEVRLTDAVLVAGVDWTASSPSGTFATLERPIVNLQVTLTTHSTGVLEIIGADRPRRTVQVQEGQGVTARDFNQAITHNVARQREAWDHLEEVDQEIIDLEAALAQAIADLEAALAQAVADLEALIAQEVADLEAALAQAVADLESLIAQEVADLEQALAQAVLDLQAQIAALAGLIDASVGEISINHYSTRGTVALADIAITVTYVQTAGYALVGDGGAALYKRVVSEPSHEGKVQSQDGAWWELAETVPTPRMFGAVGDGVIDDTSAFQNAIDYLLTLDGGTVFMPDGEYRFDVASDPLDPGLGNIAFVGQSRDNTILMFEEGDELMNSGDEKYLFTNSDDDPLKGPLEFRNFKVSGTLMTDPQSGISGIRGGGVTRLWYYPSIVLQDCNVLNVRSYGYEFLVCGSLMAKNNKFDGVGADCIRARDTGTAIVDGNSFIRGGDDAVALHISRLPFTDDVPIRENLVVTNNICISTGSIRALGSRNITIANNIMDLPNGIAIVVGVYSASSSEDDVVPYNINIQANTLLNGLRISYQDAGVPAVMEAVISVGTILPRGAAVTNSTIPTRYDTTDTVIIREWDWYQTDGTDSADPIPPAKNISIRGNTIARTRPAAAAFTDYGLGERVSGGRLFDPAITEDILFPRHGIQFTTDPVTTPPGFDGVIISENVISNLTFYGIIFPAPTGVTSYRNIIISNNVFTDNCQAGITVTSAAFSIDMLIDGNKFDIDPYRRHTNSNLDGTYDAQSFPSGIFLGNCVGAIISNNSFRNCCQATTNSNSVLLRDNTLYCGEPVASISFNTGNKGIGVIPQQQTRFKIVIIDADPTSATYGALASIPLDSSGGTPTTGWYPLGWFVENSNPVLDGNNMVVIGWKRLTTGTAHVSGTDWAQLRASHVSPAT